VGQLARQCAYADGQLFRHRLRLCFSVRQELVRFVLDRRPQRSARRLVLFRSRVAIGLERFDQSRVGSDERDRENVICQLQQVGWRTELDAATEETLEIPRVGSVRPRKGDPFGMEVVAGSLSQRLENDGDSKLSVVADAMPWNADKFDLNASPLPRSRQVKAAASLTILK
jgi:hypothetical protein